MPNDPTPSPAPGVPGRRFGAVLRVLRTEGRLLGLLRPYRWAVVRGLLVTVAITVVGVAKPWPTKVLVDDVFGTGRIGSLSRDQALAGAILLTVLLFAVSGLFSLVQQRIFLVLSQDLVRDLRGRLFGHLTRLSLRYHDDRGTGDSVYRLSGDTYAAQTVLLNGIVPLLSNLLTLALIFVVMLELDVELAFLSLVSLPAAALVARRYGRRIRRSWTVYREREAEIYTHAEQTLGAIRVVQAYAREGYELERFTVRADQSRAAMIELITLKMVFGLIVDLILALGLALVTYVAARHALDGRITAGEALVFLAYAGSLYGPFSELAGTFTELQAAAASADRIFEVLDEPHAVDDPKARAPRERATGEVRFEAVDFAYSDGDPVLHGISLVGRPGQLVALVGPTGAGKSTIVSLLLRLYDPSAGRITLDGDDLRSLPMEWLREQIGFVPQDPVLFPVSVRENIRYGRLEAYDIEVEAAAHLANILDELRHDPRGLDTPIGERGITLSGGQRQRVALARAFLKNAPILLLDEPTSALDASTEAVVMEAVDRLLVGRTALVVAHRLATVRRADTVLVVEDGRVVQTGTHQELLTRPGLYARLHAARFLLGGPSAESPSPARERVEVSDAG